MNFSATPTKEDGRIMRRNTYLTVLPLLVGLMLSGAMGQLYSKSLCAPEPCCCAASQAPDPPGLPSGCCPSEASCCDAESIPNRASTALPVPSPGPNIWSPALQASFAAWAENPLASPHAPQAYLQTHAPAGATPIYLWNLAILC